MYLSSPSQQSLPKVVWSPYPAPSVLFKASKAEIGVEAKAEEGGQTEHAGFCRLISTSSPRRYDTNAILRLTTRRFSLMSGLQRSQRKSARSVSSEMP